MTTIKVSELPVVTTPYDGSEYTLGIQNGASVKVPALNLAASNGASLVGTTPSGTLAATTVAASLTELDTEKASTSTVNSQLALKADTSTVNSQLALKTNITDLSASTGSTLVGTIQSGTGAVARTVDKKLKDRVYVTDFIPLGTVTATTDCSPYIQLALDYAGSTDKGVYFPSGQYGIGTTLTITGSYWNIIGEGTTSQLIALNDIPILNIDCRTLTNRYITISSLTFLRDNTSYANTIGIQILSTTGVTTTARNSGLRHSTFRDLTFFSVEYCIYFQDAGDYITTAGVSLTGGHGGNAFENINVPVDYNGLYIGLNPKCVVFFAGAMGPMNRFMGGQYRARDASVMIGGGLRWQITGDFFMSGIHFVYGNYSIVIDGPPLSVTALSSSFIGGTGYTDGSYSAVQLTYVSGSVATTYPTANITVSGGIVTACTLIGAGSNFIDTTTVMSCTSIGTGSGFAISPSALDLTYKYNFSFVNCQFDVVTNGTIKATNVGMIRMLGNNNMTALSIAPDFTNVTNYAVESGMGWEFSATKNINFNQPTIFGSDYRCKMDGWLNLGQTQNLTIASGVILPTASYAIIDTEGSASTDDLDTITGGRDGDILALRSTSTSRDITVKTATGNIRLDGMEDKTLGSISDSITLIKQGGLWCELGTINASTNTVTQFASNVGFGTAKDSIINVKVAGNITGGATGYGILSEGIVQTPVTASAYYFRSQNSVANSVTLDNLTSYQAAQGTIAATATVTTQTGFDAAPSLTGGDTNNFGFRGRVLASGTKNYNLYMDGTAPNYFKGNTYTEAGTTTMTSGFFYIPSAAGTPTGVPTTITGHAPMYYDTTNNKFYIYNGGWKSVVLA